MGIRNKLRIAAIKDGKEQPFAIKTKDNYIQQQLEKYSLTNNFTGILRDDATILLKIKINE